MADDKILSPQQLRSFITLIIILILINIFLASMSSSDSTNLRGEIVEAKSPAMRRAILTTLLFSVQIIGFILGGLTALIPYKSFGYLQKYLPASLITIFVIHLVIAAMEIMKFF